MQGFIDSAVQIIIAIQNLGAWLLTPMKFFSDLGTEDFFFLVMPLIYWSVDSALGIRIAFTLSISNMFNYAGKILFAGSRPYWVSPHVQAFSAEPSFGMPSGHAQNAVAAWGTIASYYKKTWVKIICWFLIFMIGFSRLYLGVHFLHDVVFGWLLGAIILWLITKYWNPVQAWIAQKTFTQQIMYIFAVSILFVLMGLIVVSVRNDYQFPQAWIENALRSSDLVPVPVDPNGIFTSAGAFFGMAFGVAWIHSHGGYQVDGPVWKRALRYVIGLIGVLILWMGLGQIFPREADVLSYTLRFVRYSLVGWWVTGGAPWVFKHFNLTTSSS